MDEGVEVDDKVALALTDSGHLGELSETQALQAVGNGGMYVLARVIREAQRLWLCGGGSC